MRVRRASQFHFPTRGYAVMNDATMPIVGEPETRRIGVGGQSFGTIMTVNLYAAGMARSVTDNRTLTPMGFRSEHRTIREAADA